MRAIPVLRAILGFFGAAVIATACGGGSKTGPTSGPTLTAFQIRPLTGEFTGRTVQWKLTAHVTGPGKLTDGHLRVRPASGAAAAQRVARAVPQAPGTCPLGAECAIELTRTSCPSEHECDVEGIWGVDRPPRGRYEGLVAFVQSDTAASNEVAFAIDIRDAPPAPPAPRPPSFADTIGAAFLHPRCTNCHGFHVPNAIGAVHAGRPATCSLCHPVPGWHAPPASFNLAGKSLPQICEMIKTSRGNDAAAIEHHLKQDVLIQWAISSGVVEGSVQRGGLAPPGNLGAWNARIDEWVAGGLSCG